MPRLTSFGLAVKTLLLAIAVLAVTAPARAAAPANYNCLTPPAVALTLTTTPPIGTPDPVFATQDNFNCFAWQAFINLTWAAKPGNPGVPDPSVPPSQYGMPQFLPVSTWETFSAKDSVFKPNAGKPDPFGHPPVLPPNCKVNLAGDHVPLYAITKLMGDGTGGLADINQAGMGNFGWVTAQNGRPTYYDVRLNQPEYDYIVGNQLYDATMQAMAAQDPKKGLLLPNGTVEIKAAWLEILDKTLWPRYRMIQTIIEEPDPKNPKAPALCRVANMGLVAIHMIHKTKLSQQFAWTTFEHVDNQPTAGGDAAPLVGKRFTYFNPVCDPATDAYKCQINAAPCLDPNKPGTCRPISAPNQVEKIIPMPPATATLNADMQAKIKAANPNSVYQYYQLVDTLWPSDNTTIPAAAYTPLYDGNPQPPLAQGGLLNPLIETYFQAGDPNHTGQNAQRGFLSCQSCHVFAGISLHQPAPVTCPVSTLQGQPAGQTGTCASDYSFLFKVASCPKGVQCAK